MIQIPDKLQHRADYASLATAILRERPVAWRWQKLAVLGSHTTELLNPYLVVEAGRHALGLDIWNGPFGQIEQQGLDPDSGLFSCGADVILLLPEVQAMAPDLVLRYLALPAEEVETQIADLVQRLRKVVESIRALSSASILLGNLAAPAWSAAGVLDPMLERPFASVLAALNQRLSEVCRNTAGVQLFDLQGLSAAVGSNQWRDERMALLARAPFTGAAMTAIGRLAARHLRAAYEFPKKCLVLDLDNTLWGGVLGESGLAGIQLGPDYPGNAFVDFQQRVLALRDRGILLAVASKNNLVEVEAVLEQHPACVLKRAHFSAFEVHWEDKAASLRRIAQTLNLGLDAIVFFDDSPVEREWVRSQVPAVTVIEVPKSPMLYGAALEQSLAFDAFVLTAEDRTRAELYQQESARSQSQAGAASLDEFIRTLEMEVTVGWIDDASLPRVVQLLGKTNQFNLTTRRHDQARLQALLAAGAIGLWARVRDRFGDSGLVAAALAVQEHEGWMIDTLLMSCRVIGRGVETAVLGVLERMVHQRGAREIFGRYIPTAKNQPAADFFERHDYRQRTPEDGRWHLCLDELRPLPESFTIIGPHTAL